ncbi:glycosyltransferase family 4 protein [Novosphingobium panipatense]|uniref:glycosyltransferase family 4 protein n=1 Tax=Novosphingobium TaxID=165696 RepID=UPI001E28E426|nr:glycosyltransferase family 4 protein [Novosphingobium sp. HII-3]
MNAFAMTGLAPRVPAPVEGRPTICLPFSGDELGGSHVSVRGLLEGLDHERYRVILVPEVSGGKIARSFAGYEQKADPARSSRPFVPGEPFGLLKAVQALSGAMKRARFLRGEGVALVHTNDGRTHASWALAARIAGARLLWHHRGDPEAKGLRHVAPVLASQVVTVSRFALPSTKRGALSTAQVVYSPFDTAIQADRASMRARILQRIGSSEDTVLCGYFGNFISRKRPLEFVAAVERLAERSERPVAGLMFGDESNTDLGDALPRRIEAMRRGAVHMMGYCSPGHEWLAGCDLLLVPAAREPLGRTLVEAMLVGTLVVATDSGGNAEALHGGCGVLCPLDDPDAMAAAAAELLANEAKAQAMREVASAQARLRFSSEHHVRQISKIYDRLASP